MVAAVILEKVKPEGLEMSLAWVLGNQKATGGARRLYVLSLREGASEFLQFICKQWLGRFPHRFH